MTHLLRHYARLNTTPTPSPQAEPDHELDVLPKGDADALGVGPLGRLGERDGGDVRGAPAAIATLGAYNRFTLKNPNRDYFSVRRAWIELELADGRRASSDIAAATFTQPPEWPYAEGIGVPFGTDIEFVIWFRLK